MRQAGRGVLIMAGGTGGHIFPGLAVANVLRQKGVPVRWLGAKGGMEARTVPEAGIELDLVNITGLRGNGLVRWVRMPLMLARAVWQARRLLAANRPGCAVSFGGYAAAPGGIAAWTKGIPVLVHEQNRIPGMTNRLLSRFSRRILQGFPGTFPDDMSPIDSGNPVRREVAEITEPQIRLAGRSGPVRVLITGGSQGARVLNETVPAAFGLLLSATAIEIRHQAGAKQVEQAREAYAGAGVEAKIEPFIEDMAAAYTWADLVICRSGALTVAELAAAGVASVLVPYPHAVDDHQTRNAEYLSSGNAAIILPQASLDPQALAAELKPLLSDREKLLAMATAARQLAFKDAAEKVVAACSEWVCA
jgi:UDP-N-acetylglucosamine--N-acetylmuramyl-(pentapeptide) pyrophosphoryl-undecaprenol N-acetylglucosamine transferase